jgi:TorA maturation chaperone TorD
MSSSEITQSPQALAWATLFDALSIAFTYPSPSLFSALNQGDFIRVMADEVALIPGEHDLEAELQLLEEGISKALEEGEQALETAYIALFEVNRIQAPLHLYAHLYADGSDGQIMQMQRLQALYQRYGLETKQGEGTEYPDHLVVELEFMAYLFLHMVQAQQSGQDDQALRYVNAIGEFVKEMQWIHRFTANMVHHTRHPFYASLAKFLDVLLSQVESVVGDPRLLHSL